MFVFLYAQDYELSVVQSMVAKERVQGYSSSRAAAALTVGSLPHTADGMYRS